MHDGASGPRPLEPLLTHSLAHWSCHSITLWLIHLPLPPTPTPPLLQPPLFSLFFFFFIPTHWRSNPINPLLIAALGTVAVGGFEKCLGFFSSPLGGAESAHSLEWQHCFCPSHSHFSFFFSFTRQHHFRNYISFQELLWDVSADGGVRAERLSPATVLSEGGNVTSVTPLKLTLWKWTLECSRADLFL